MKKAAVVLVALVIVMLVVPAAFAQGGAPEQKLPLNPTTLAMAAGFGVAIAALVAVWVRDASPPRPAKASRAIPEPPVAFARAMILGLVFVETLTLFTFALGFLLYRLL